MQINRIDRALTKLDELTIEAEDFFCVEVLNPHVKIWLCQIVKMPRSFFLGYTETINNEMIAEKEISAEDTLNSSDFHPMRKLSKYL